MTLDLYDGVYAALLVPSPVKVRLIGHETTGREDWMDITITRTPGDPFSRKVKIEGRGHVYNIPGVYKVTPVMPEDETANLTSMLCDGLLPVAGAVPVAPFEYYFVLVGDCDDNGVDDADDIADDRLLNGFPGTLDVWPLDGFIDNCYWGDCDADVNCDFALDGFDVETQEKAVGGDMTDYCAPDPDFNGDFALDGFDVEAIEIVVGGGPCPEMPT